ncbi:MAG: ABC transporter substrate-binding protein [Casimicrobium sp.]
MYARSSSLCLSLPCIALAWLGITSASNAQTNGVFPDKVLLHHVGPFSNSVLATSNKEVLDAADLYLKTVNDAGGVNGRKVVFERVDDNQDPKKSEVLAKEIAEKKSTLGFVLPRTSVAVEMMLKLSDQYNVPLIGPQPGPTVITNPFKRQSFAVRASYNAEILRAIELQHAYGHRKFAFVVADEAFGNDVEKGLPDTLGKFSLKPVAFERVDNRKPDVTKALATILPLKPDVIIYALNSAGSADFIKKYKAAGGVAQHVALTNNSNSGFVKALGADGPGVIVMQVLPSPYSPKYKISSDYRKAAEAAKQPISYQSFQGYVTARVVVEALRRTGKNPTPESFTKAMESITSKDFDGFIVNFGPKERMGSKFVEATMISKDGRFVY